MITKEDCNLHKLRNLFKKIIKDDENDGVNICMQMDASEVWTLERYELVHGVNTGDWDWILSLQELDLEERTVNISLNTYGLLIKRLIKSEMM